MPIYEYKVVDGVAGCSLCRAPFEQLHRKTTESLRTCPRCGAPVMKLVSAPRVGASAAGYDDRAKSAGFHKLKRLGKGNKSIFGSSGRAGFRII